VFTVWEDAFNPPFLSGSHHHHVTCDGDILTLNIHTPSIYRAQLEAWLHRYLPGTL
jgi:hypothetical protein